MTSYAFICICQKPEYLCNEMRYCETQDAILSHFENTFRQNQNWIDDFFIVVAL